MQVGLHTTPDRLIKEDIGKREVDGGLEDPEIMMAEIFMMQPQTNEY